ncbi:hypothetical protein NIES4071_68560 [Calothrix sp. NIES-4071]|nr:hypothetical protein NIES4071_68560 [Calothrix sp. NIES-4071]BAZ61134.1 hypothetical protein NIES4105_68520 [Calothrix sp. NIES-4105]
MIKNEKQYEYSKDCARRFKYSIAVIEKDEAFKQKDPEGWQLDIDVKKSHLMALQAEIAEYELLTSHDGQTPIVLRLDDIDYLAQILIKARMAAKLSQKELADLTGLPVEKIKQYEDDDYASASFLDVRYVIDALDIQIQTGEFLLPLDTLRRTPVTKEELFSAVKNKSEEVSSTI